MVSFKQRLEFHALKGLIRLFRLLPLALVQSLAVCMAWIMHRVFAWRRKEAMRRIREVLGNGPTRAQVNRIAWVSFRNLWFNAIELIRAKKTRPEFWSRHVDNQAVLAELHRLQKEGRGLIVALVHAGNWDLAGVMTATAGIPGVFVARAQKNPLVNGMMNEFREMTGALVVDRDDPHLIRKVVRALKAGRILAILIDLRARKPGLRLPFLGKPADIGAGLGVIAHLSGAPVLPVFLSRLGWRRHRWECGAPIHPDFEVEADAERVRIQAVCLEWLGQRVIRDPEQYFWYNKRWVLEPLNPEP